MNQELLQVIDSIYKMNSLHMHYLCQAISPMSCKFKCTECPLIKYKERFRYKYIPQLISIKEVK